MQLYLVPLADRVVGDMAPTLTVLAGAVTLLLLIACVNLASLLLNKSAARADEFSIRAAIGGSRWDLIRQLFIEQALLVVIGGVLGALAGAAILTGLVSMAPRDMPRLDEIRLDLVVLSWTTLLSCACAFVFGIVPALKASGIGGQELVVRSGRGSTRSASVTAPGLDDGGDRRRDGAALRSRADGAHDGSAGARGSWLRSAQPADVHVLADGPAVARRQETGVLRRRGRTPSRAAGRGERRGHLFAADSRLELVEHVHDRRQDRGALDIASASFRMRAWCP